MKRLSQMVDKSRIVRKEDDVAKKEISKISAKWSHSRTIKLKYDIAEKTR